MKIELQVYSYQEREGSLCYRATYTIRKGVKPLGFKGEKLEQEFSIERK